HQALIWRIIPFSSNMVASVADAFRTALKSSSLPSGAVSTAIPHEPPDQQQLQFRAQPPDPDPGQLVIPSHGASVVNVDSSSMDSETGDMHGVDMDVVPNSLV